MAAALGTLVFAFSTIHFLREGPVLYGRDFTYPWLAAHALFTGVDAYRYIANGPTPPYGHVFFYPLTAGVAALPFAWIRVEIAAALFAGVSAAWLAFVMTRDQWWRLVTFTSALAWQAFYPGQWSPMLLAAGLTMPALGLLCVKPTLAIPLLAMQSMKRAFISAATGGALLIGISFFLQPHWLFSWRQTMHDPLSGQFHAPIFSRWGIPLALAGLRWRRPEARLLLGMALIPQTSFLYDQLPLVLIPESRRQLLIRSVSSWAVFFAQQLTGVGAHTYEALSQQRAPVMIVGLYFPALLMLLRRPNVAQ